MENMHPCCAEIQNGVTRSQAARERILSSCGEPLFIGEWRGVLMIHFEIGADELQRDVPFALDLRDGRAFVSLVAFSMRKMRPLIGGEFSAWLFRPIASHEFLNVRTYVRRGGETGIHFLAEWVSSALAVKLGPATFSLPYRHGRIAYRNNLKNGVLNGRVTDTISGAEFSYEGSLPEPVAFAPCPTGSLDEWLMERYTAFNCARGRKKFFCVWHPTWPQCPAQIAITKNSLLTQNWPWFQTAKYVGANFSPGFEEVWMGRPRKIAA
jgi:uncharacterized protein YqjF (DUF2071 family)